MAKPGLMGGCQSEADFWLNIAENLKIKYGNSEIEWTSSHDNEFPIYGQVQGKTEKTTCQEVMWRDWHVHPLPTFQL